MMGSNLSVLDQYRAGGVQRAGFLKCGSEMYELTEIRAPWLEGVEAMKRDSRNLSYSITADGI